MAELPRAARGRGRAGWILASFLTMLMVIDLELRVRACYWPSCTIDRTLPSRWFGANARFFDAT